MAGPFVPGDLVWATFRFHWAAERAVDTECCGGTRRMLPNFDCRDALLDGEEDLGPKNWALHDGPGTVVASSDVHVRTADLLLGHGPDPYIYEPTELWVRCDRLIVGPTTRWISAGFFTILGTDGTSSMVCHHVDAHLHGEPFCPVHGELVVP